MAECACRSHTTSAVKVSRGFLPVLQLFFSRQVTSSGNMTNLFLVIYMVVSATFHLSETSPLRIQKRAAFYIANETACVVDNTVYSNGDPIPTDDPCEACKCRPPGFACVLKECEVKPGCRAVRRAGYCCPEYICGCEHNGRMYRDGDEIRDTQNPCYTCHCQGSSIACAFIDCFFRVDCAPEYVPGECCPRYDHCIPIGTVNNTFTGENLPSAYDEQPSSEASYSSSLPQETEVTELSSDPPQPTNIEIFREETSNSQSEVGSSESNSEERETTDSEEATASDSTENLEHRKDESVQTEKFDSLPTTQADSEIIGSSEEQSTAVTSIPNEQDFVSGEQEHKDESSLLKTDFEIEQAEKVGKEETLSSTEASSETSEEESSTVDENFTSLKANEDPISTTNNDADDDQTTTEENAQTSVSDSSSISTDSIEVADTETDHSKSLKLPSEENDLQDLNPESTENKEKLDESNSENSDSDPTEKITSENSSVENQSDQSPAAEQKLSTEDTLTASSTGKETTEETGGSTKEEIKAEEINDAALFSSDEKKISQEPEAIVTTMNIKEATDTINSSKETENLSSENADEAAELLFKALNDAIDSAIDQKLSGNSTLAPTSQGEESSTLSAEQNSEETSPQTTGPVTAERKEKSETEKSDSTLQTTASSIKNAKGESTQSTTISEAPTQNTNENFSTFPSKETNEAIKLTTEATTSQEISTNSE